MTNQFFKQHFISSNQITKDNISFLFKEIDAMKQTVLDKGNTDILSGKIIACVFYEPTTRTFSSFVTAAQRLGAGFIPLQGMTMSSAAKGETLEDTIQTLAAYSDAIVLRHPESGSAKFASQYSPVPIINAGDGNNEHPSQSVLDLYTIHEKFGTLDNLTGLMAGDVLNSRGIHSLIKGLSIFENNTIYLLSPENLKLSRELFSEFTQRGIKIIEITSEKDIPDNCQFWYWTRVFKERFATPEEYDYAMKTSFKLTPKMLDEHGNKDMIIMDLLPRINSVDPAIDDDKRAVYFRNQIRNGLYTRMALLKLILHG